MITDSFTTERLVLRNWRSDLHSPDLRRSLETTLSLILSDRVLEHLPPPLQLADTQGAVCAWITERAAESEVYLVIERANKDLVGLLILAAEPDATDCPTIHIGYLLAETAWGRGFATELVSGLVSALKGQGPVRLVGGVGTGNVASARVLQKAGFHLDHALTTPDTEMFVCLLD